MQIYCPLNVDRYRLSSEAYLGNEPKAVTNLYKILHYTNFILFHKLISMNVSKIIESANKKLQECYLDDNEKSISNRMYTFKKSYSESLNKQINCISPLQMCKLLREDSLTDVS